MRFNKVIEMYREFPFEIHTLATFLLFIAFVVWIFRIMIYNDLNSTGLVSGDSKVSQMKEVKLMFRTVSCYFFAPFVFIFSFNPNVVEIVIEVARWMSTALIFMLLPTILYLYWTGNKAYKQCMNKYSISKD